MSEARRNRREEQGTRSRSVPPLEDAETEKPAGGRAVVSAQARLTAPAVRSASAPATALRSGPTSARSLRQLQDRLFAERVAERAAVRL